MKRRAEAPADDEKLTPTQRKILTAALEVFSERGFSGASTAAIAQRAKVAEKTLFARFKSKRELLARTLRPSVLLLAEPRAIESVREAIEPRGKSLKHVITALMKDRLALAARHPKKIKLIAHELLLRPDFVQSFGRTIQQSVAPSALATLADLAKRKQIRTDLPIRTIVRTLVSVTVGYAVARYVLGLERDVDDDKEIANIVSLLVDGLKPR